MDETIFEQIVNAHYESLYRFALSLTHQEADARDATHETFHRLVTKGHQLKDLSKVKTWLFTTLYREVLGARRRAARFPQVEVTAVEHELPTADPPEPQRMDGATALAALRQLEELYRAPLALFYLENHSYREIAQILGIPIGTVMSRLARGKALLRRLLSDRPRPAGEGAPPLEPARTKTEP